jgi:hypothetical protein
MAMSKNSLKKFGALLSAAGLAHGVAVAQPILIPGFLTFEAYTNIPGTAVDALLAAPEYPDSPAQVLHMTGFDTRTVYPNDSHDNFGARISGFLTPTETADYELFLRSDDASQLFISPDDNPANLEPVPIAQETGCCGAFEETGAPETSAARTLVAGQRYAIQAIYKEGGGGDYCQVAWRKVGDTTPAAQLSPIPSAFLSTLIAPRGNITVTTQPTSTTAARNDFITLSVQFTATHGPAVVLWQRNGANIPGLSGNVVDYGPLADTDNGAKLRAVISIPGATTNSAEAMLTVTPDVTRPTIKSVVGSDTFDMLTVVFSEAVDDFTAGDSANYALDGGLDIVGLTILSSTTVRLTTTQQTPGATYTLTVDNIVDTAGLTTAPGTSKTFTALDRVRGGLKFETWLGIAGNGVSALTSDPRYPANPDVVAYVRDFTSRLVYADANSVDNYGGRLSGWIVPPEDAEYEFFIRSDDNSELRLSTDDNPANAVTIASEGGCCGPFEEPGAPETSAPTMLLAGQRYYIEALWKEGGGGDYCDVAWRKVGTPGPALNLTYIPGSVLETYAAPGTFTPPTVAFSSPANGANFDVGAAVTLTAIASVGSGKTIVRVEFFEQGRQLGEATRSPYSLTLYELREDNHTFIARATDSAGIFTDSAPLSISVGAQVQQLTLAAIDDVHTFRYDRTGRDLGTEWLDNNYDDSTWPEGKMLIADEGTTTVEPIRTRISRFNDQGQYVRTFYYRTHFNFPQPVSPSVKLKLRHVVDDGVVIYLNGMEIHRFGIAAGVVVNYLTDAAGHENAYEGPFDIPLDNLQSGDNVLAAEVHQAGGGSSDTVFGLELIATVPVIRPTLTIARDGASVRISWTPTGGTLESAPTVTGQWSTVNGGTNPYIASPDGLARFYRVRF